MRPTGSLDTRLYQAALFLYPPAFRREFSPEMVRDFDEARHETGRAGQGHGLWAFRAEMGADLACTVVLQWVRTGLPLIVLVSAIAPLIAASALANLWQRMRFVMPVESSDADILALQLMAAIVLLIIAATIILTLWFTRPLLYRSRR